MTLPAEIKGILPEMVELARERGRPIARHTRGGWLLNAWLLPDSTPVVAVMVQPRTAMAAAPQEPDADRRGAEAGADLNRLCGEFGLTRAEARVARLLLRRLSNREVAEALSISPHTARHHTGKILLKLGITRRSEVPARLTEVGITP